MSHALPVGCRGKEDSKYVQAKDIFSHSMHNNVKRKNQNQATKQSLARLLHT
jgi:hypothetical protein